MTRPITRRLASATALTTLAFAALAANAPAALAQAEDYPSRPISLYVGFPPGGGTDALARLLAPHASAILGQPVVVENRPGANAKVAADLVAHSEPDGYSLLLTTPGALVISPHITREMSYDPLTDLIPVTALTGFTTLLVVNSDVEAQTIQEFIALAKAHPGEMTFATAGIASPMHLAGELFNKLAGTDLLHIPYAGTGPATMAVLGGEVDASFAAVQAVVPQVRAGDLRALAIGSAERSASLPDVPTMAESGLEGYQLNVWLGLLAPTGTPDEIVQKLQQAFTQALEVPEVKAFLEADGSQPLGTTTAAFGEMISADYVKFGDLISGLDIEAE